MALTELQLPTKDNFYRSLQSAASQMDTVMKRWQDVAEFIGFVETVDLDAMGVPSGQIRTDLINLRTAMNEVVGFYYGDAATATNPPHEVVDKLRKI